MRKTIEIVRSVVSVVLLLIACIKAQAQTYPVQVNTQILAPYSPYLTDYTAVGAQRLIVNFTLNDPTLTEYRGKLRITIEGVGITIRTKQSFIPQRPLVLPGGSVPLMLYGEDLEEYFNPGNLDFAGLSKNQYEKGAKLPEGVYRFTIEVLDYNRNTVVSNKGTAIAWIILNDPPLLNLPRNETKAAILDPTNIAFTWTPRHTGSPNSAFTTEYIFKLVEIWPASRNPYDAFLSQQPLYEITTSSTQIVYGPAEPALIPGRKYAWQVQAKDTEDRDLFKNNGKSEVYVFQFGDQLGIPENLALQKANPSSLVVRWEQPTAGTDAVSYRVRYRPHNSRSHDEWYSELTSDQWKSIPQLQPNTEYEVQVRAEQSTQVSDYGPVKIFKTAIAGANDFVCKSDVSPPAVPVNAIPATQLGINDTLYAAGYEVLVREITANEGGTYTGSGMMIVPWFQSAKVRMTFKNIRVNEQHWLTAGEIKSVWNADSKFLVKSEKKVDSTNVPLNGELPVNIVATETLIEITGAAIATVTKDDEGNIEVYTTDGEKKVLPKGKSYSIADEVGNGYVVDEKGNITKTTADEARAAAGRGDRNYTIALTFNKGNGKYGFDEKKYEALSSYYQQVEGGHYIPWKAVTASQPDAVAATLEGTDIDADKVRFEINGSKVPAINSGSNYTLSVRGGAEGMVEELLALYTPSDTAKDNVLGKLNLVSYDQLTRNLVIVPVNGATIPGGLSSNILSQKLTEIYGQAVATWDVKIEPSIKVSLDDTFDDGESGLLTNYTGDMKKVIKAYGNLLDKTYYIFLVPKPKSGGSALGYMPRSKQAGFIFTDNLNSTTAITTIAHEVGHGAFNLKHTFSEFPSLSKSSTDNLMDYSSGQTLYKYQWDNIHNPQKVIGLFENDDESEMVLPCLGIFDDCDDVLAIINGIKSRVTNNAKLPVFKPDQAKNRKSLYDAYYLTVGDTDFNHILISNEILADTLLDPKIYYDFNSTNEDHECQAGFMLKANEKSLFKILIGSEKDSLSTFAKVEKLRKYIFGDLKPTGAKNEQITNAACSSGFCCTKCSRDLAMTQERLQLIFPNSTMISQNGAEFADIFNTALQIGKFNTCDRQAKLFAQIQHESIGFKARVEGQNSNGVDRDWPIDFILTYFNKSAGAKNHFFNQNFWDKTVYKSIITSNYYEKVDTLGTHKSEKSTDYYGKYNGKDQAQYHVKIPAGFKSDSTGKYKKYIVPVNQKVQYRKNMFIKAYDGANGNIKIAEDANTTDGWTYRGRGAIQLTGRSNYQRNQQEIAKKFNKVVDLLNQPELVATDNEVMVYSAIAFILQNVSNINNFDTMSIDQVSALVNTGSSGSPIENVNGGADRRERYKTLIENSNLFKCHDE
ncbi:fibronectin type III domain-containing protein [Ohtaekwangia kribbensis]|uniref:Fibronectin type III domain-containing protein n=1 Tax=Ohtaekwangia kribbensis TaxID=688913 RepID=A0ABW3JZ70_9BACT